MRCPRDILQRWQLAIRLKIACGYIPNTGIPQQVACKQCVQSNSTIGIPVRTIFNIITWGNSEFSANHIAPRIKVG
jgi:hypothetical protein